MLIRGGFSSREACLATALFLKCRSVLPLRELRPVIGPLEPFSVFAPPRASAGGGTFISETDELFHLHATEFGAARDL
jgi:hypothetical protein